MFLRLVQFRSGPWIALHLSGARYCDKKARGVWPMAGSDVRSGGVTLTLSACEEKCIQNDHCAWVGCDH